MAEEILQAVLMLIIAVSFGGLFGFALGKLAFGSPKLYSAKQRDIAKSAPVWRSGPGANNHEA